MATPNELAALAACYNCIPEGMQKPVLIYILTVLAGQEGVSANDLMTAAKCYLCIPEGMQDPIISYLLDQVASA